MDPRSSIELSPDELVFTVDPADIARFRKQQKNIRIIGQPRALKALGMGCRISAKGYNIFVCGKPGTGRKTAIQQVLSEFAGEQREVRDIAVVYNFADPDRPMILYPEPGKAKQLKKQLHRITETLKLLVKEKLDSELYKSKKNTLLTEAEKEEDRRISEFEEKLARNNFRMIQTMETDAGSTDLEPIIDGESVSFEELQEQAKNGSFPREEWTRLRENYYHFMDETRLLFRYLRSKRAEVEEKVQQLQRDLLKDEVRHEISIPRALCPEEDIQHYLSAVEEDILNHLYLFTAEETATDERGNRSFIRYGVNVLVDNSDTTEVPILFETRPDTENLLGTIEYKMYGESEARTNFMMIRPGYLIRSSGGFLIIEAEQILQDQTAWQTLKQALKTGTAEIHPPKSTTNLPLPAPRSEPVRINPKVLLLGGEGLYDNLYTTDPDIPKLFKVIAEFDDTMPRNDESVIEFLSYMDDFLEKNNLGSIDHQAAARVVAYGSELVEDRRKLSTRFFRIADMLTEAHHWSRIDKKKSIDLPSVERALEEHRYLFSLPEEKLFDHVSDGSIVTRFEGKAVGKIHGLAVRDRGSYSFGIPAVITCSVSPGRGGIVNIEREAGLSGEIHDKGMFILEGLLRSRFAVSFPLSVHGSICFEQSYGGIDGDSASTAEVCALLSALSAVPFRQDIAVTGSMNQNGDLQPVGGINDKVRGFFKTCSRLGLPGGVLIPGKNIKNFFPDKALLAAVRDGRFHIYAADSIDQVTELLSGLKSGERNDQGVYPEGTLGFLVEKRLKTMAEVVKEYGK